MILPQPQKITYGSGKFYLKGIAISFASKPVAEDKFAAKELSKIISKATSSPVAVKETSVAGSAIILKRTVL